MYFRIYNIDGEQIKEPPVPLAKRDSKTGEWGVYINNLEDFLYSIRQANSEVIVNYVAGEFTLGVY